MSIRTRLLPGVATLTALLAFWADASSVPARDEVARAVEGMATAAGGKVTVSRSRVTGTVGFLAAPAGVTIPVEDASATTPEARATAFVGRYAKAFGLQGPSDVMAVTAPSTDELGMDHVRLQQFHGGVPVTAAELGVHLKGDGVVSVLGKTLPDLAGIATEPRLSASDAELLAREDVARELQRTDVTVQRSRLEIFNRGLLEGVPGPSRLAWFVELTGDSLREFAWIDARRGIVLLRFSQLTTAKRRLVYSANNTPNIPGTLRRSEGQAATNDADVNAAYDYAGDTYDYFWNQHGRDSYDGGGATMVSSVHFCTTTECPLANAGWTGAPPNQMVYGDGFSRADDVTAHELTHAVTEHSANLFYYMQSGALNESISDIFGETVDLTNGKGNDSSAVRWQLAEDLPSGGAIRSMMTPNQYGDPNRMGDSGYFACFSTSDTGVHTNSGVPNHAYALMVDGGTFNGRTVAGIGLTKAGKVVYRTLVSYLLSGSDFLDFNNAMRQSCSDLVGSVVTAADCTQVAAALDAVEMASPWPCAPVQTATPAFCTPPSVYATTVFSDNLEDPNSGIWSKSTASGINHWEEGEGSPDIYFPLFATSGVWSFWGYEGNWQKGDSAVAMANAVSVPAGAKMQFNHSFGFTSGGHGVLEYSANGGAWTDAGSLIVSGARYTCTIASSTDPLNGRQAFCWDSWGYTTSQLDLASLAGRNVRFRFRIASTGGNAIGWFVDDVRIFTCVAPPSITIGDVSVAEGDTGTTPAVLPVSLSGAFPAAVTVNYSEVGASATAGSDFIASAGTLSFPPGTTSRTIAVPVFGDRLNEPAETFTVNLQDPVNSTLARAQGVVTIVDNDLPGLAISDAVASEPTSGTGTATFTVTLSPANAGTVTVGYATADGTAFAPTDYTATTAGARLTFLPGQTSLTIAVPVNAVPGLQGPRSFHVDLSGASGAAITRARGTASLYDTGFYPIAPCRVLDTRDSSQGPAISAGRTATFVVGGRCGIPTSTKAVALNLTVVSPSGGGDLRIFPFASAMPLVSAINYSPSQTRANNATVPLGPDGLLAVFCEQATGVVDLIIDVNGFYE